MEQWEYGIGTHTGHIRELNEDRYATNPKNGLWVIADGMGGCEAGEAASAAVVEAILASMAHGSSLVRAINDAHQAVVDLLKRGEGASGMGSTVVLLQLRGQRYDVAWVGDSRAYLWSRGKLHLLTRDDTVVQTLVDGGVIDAREARDHPERSKLTQALGPIDSALLKAHTTQGRLRVGEQILLCSDGLTSELKDEQIAAILKKNWNAQRTVDRLIEAALTAGGQDNITVVLVGSPTQSLQPDHAVEDTGNFQVITQPVELIDDNLPSSKSFRMAAWLVPLTLFGLAFFSWWWQQRNH